MGRPLVDVAEMRIERADGDRRFRLTVPWFRLAAGDRVAVIGPSGSGKSTFIETIACARAPAAAARFDVLSPGVAPGGAPDVALDVALDVAGAWAAGREGELTRLRGQAFGYVPQTGGLLDFLSVRDNIAVSQRLSRRRDSAWIDRLAGVLGIQPLLRSMPARLSGGQRQRVAIARALAHRPAVVIADEPTASLDRAVARVVMRLLCETAQDAGAALLVATHDVALAEAFDFSVIDVGEDGNAGPGEPDAGLQAVALAGFPAAGRPA